MSSTPPPPGPGQPEQPGDPRNPYQPGVQPPFGQDPYAPNPYAPNPYGQAPYGQAPYGQAPPPPGGKGLAIAALVLAFLPLCLTQVAAFVMGIVVLTSRRAGRGLAIAAIVVSLVMVGVLLVLGLAGLGSVAERSLVDLEEGQCIDAEGLGGGQEVDRIEVVSCSDPHFGEVLAAAELSADEAERYEAASVGDVCGPYVSQEELAALPPGVAVTSLTRSPDPDPGDILLCVAYSVDGSELTEPLG